MSNTLFRKKSLDKVSSPEQLNEYIRVTNPSVWVILGAVCVLLAAVLVWGFTGTLPTTITASGQARGRVVTMYLSPEEASQVSVGMEAAADGVKGKVSAIADAPLSYDEALSIVQSDYAAYTLGIGQWNVPVSLQMEGEVADGMAQTTITLGQTRPIDFILN